MGRFKIFFRPVIAKKLGAFREGCVGKNSCLAACGGSSLGTGDSPFCSSQCELRETKKTLSLEKLGYSWHEKLPQAPAWLRASLQVGLEFPEKGTGSHSPPLSSDQQRARAVCH